MTKAIIFDFDGLILDTETPFYQSWQEIYLVHGGLLPLDKWCECIGSMDGIFDPYDYLEEQLERPIDRDSVRAKRRARFAELMAAQSLLPGVERYLEDARRLGLKVGLATSSPRSWIDPYLCQFGLQDSFDTIKCADDVQHTKPDPALYLAALEALEVPANEAIAIEDSPNGLLAARRAGIYCMVVPNGVTRHLNLEQANLKCASLEERCLQELLRLKDKQQTTSRD